MITENKKPLPSSADHTSSFSFVLAAIWAWLVLKRNLVLLIRNYFFLPSLFRFFKPILIKSRISRLTLPSLLSLAEARTLSNSSSCILIWYGIILLLNVVNYFINKCRYIYIH